MKALKNQSVYIALALSILFSACKKDKTVDPDIPAANQGIYILSQGLINSNNSSLGFYNELNKEMNQDIFNQVNMRGLGDTGNDIQLYGSKLYVVMNVSNTVEVMDAS